MTEQNSKEEFLVIVAQVVNRMTGKNFSVADVELVSDLLDNFKKYQENK